MFSRKPSTLAFSRYEIGQVKLHYAGISLSRAQGSDVSPSPVAGVLSLPGRPTGAAWQVQRKVRHPDRLSGRYL